MIIAAYAGTGKTTLASMYPEKYIDFVLMPYKYELEPDGDCGEAGKANPDNILQYDWPYNYVNAILGAMQERKHLLIPTDLQTLALLCMKNIPYVLCYPQQDAKEIYRRRFLQRGNNEHFIDIFIGHWDNFVSMFEQDAFGHHLALRPDEYLCDAISRIEFDKEINGPSC
jgi:hypothetical protein